jgi:CHAD domain-containing protein
MIQGLSMVEGIRWTDSASIQDGQIPRLDEALEACQGDDGIVTAEMQSARQALGRIREKALAAAALVASQHMQRVEEEAAAFIAARAERERGTFP